MKKGILIILATMVMGFSASAQIFILESVDDGCREPNASGMGFTNPDIHNSGEDWAYVPVGSGTLLLAGLAGAYLLGKKKKK